MKTVENEPTNPVAPAIYRVLRLQQIRQQQKKESGHNGLLIEQWQGVIHAP